MSMDVEVMTGEKKLVSFYLREHVYDMLQEIRQELGMKKSEVVEYLIEEAYNYYKKEGKNAILDFVNQVVE